MPPKGAGGGSSTSSLSPEVIENIKKELARKRTLAESTLLKYNRLSTLENNSKGPKFLIMKHGKHAEGTTMANISPFLVSTAITGTAGEEMEVKLLRDGTILIHTKNVQQAQKLIKLSGLSSSIPVTVVEHVRLNTSKGVIMCRALNTCSEEEILQHLKEQGVTEIYAVKKTFQGVQKLTGTYFLTFSTTKIPEEVKVAYMNVKVSPYIPEPTRCFNCLQYGHISKNCTQKERLCINCANPHHTDEGEKCTNAPKCIHCPEKHNSISRECHKYVQQKSILKIKVSDSVSFPEAAKRYRMMNPTLPNERTSYASVVEPKKCKCACTCQSTATPQQQQTSKNKHGSTASSDQIPTKIKRNEYECTVPDGSSDDMMDSSGSLQQ